MDFPLNSSLNSSLVLALAVALWLLWVGPYFFRRPAPAVPAATTYNDAVSNPPANASRPPASPDKGSQGNTMNTISHTPSGGGSTQSHSYGEHSAGAPAPRPFRIRTGRMALAATGLVALLAVVAGGVLAAFTSVSWLVPATGVVLTAAVVAALRSLAVRDRRRRVDHAFRAAMGPEPAPRSARPADTTEPAPAAVPEPVRETVLFDLQAVPAPDSEVQAAAPVVSPRLSAGELRAEALKVAAATPARPSTTPWEPVAVPKPVYVDAPKAERPAPEPIVLPEPPRPLTKTPIRPTAAPAASTAADASDAGKINLDDVLQRRRA